MLALLGERLELPATRQFEAALRESLLSPAQPIDVFPEFADFARFPAKPSEAYFAEYLRARYQGRQIDLVVAGGDSGLDFILRHRDLFPGVPVVFGAVATPYLTSRPLPGDVFGVPVAYDYAGTVGLIRTLQPKLRELILVAGTSAFDQRMTAEAREALKSLPPQIETRWIIGAPLDELLGAMRQVSRSSAVLFMSMSADRQGGAYSSRAVVSAVCQASAAPVYGLAENFLELGIVGGRLHSFAEDGRRCGQLARGLLEGRPKPTGELVPALPEPMQIHWKALQRWGLSEANLPPDAKVLFREPDLWSEYGGFLVGGGLAIVLQLFLISGLARQRNRLRVAQQIVDERLRFEQLITKLSGTFANLPHDRIEPQIVQALGQLAEILRFDFAALTFTPEAQHPGPKQLRWPEASGGAWPAHFPPPERPWTAEETNIGRQQQAGSDAPAGALGSIYETPVFAGGCHVGTLAVGAHQAAGALAPQLLPRLRLVGEIFQSALTRRHDAEALSESHNRMAIAAEAANLGFYSWDLARDEVWASERTQNFFGVRPGQRPRWSEFLAVVHPDDRESIQHSVERAIKEGALFSVEYRVALPSEPVRWLGARGHVDFVQGAARRLVGVCLDLSATKQSELHLQRQRDELARLGRVTVLGELAASLAHELNQPLTAMITNAAAGNRYLARGQMPTEQMREIMDDIMADGHRAGEVIAGIRRMARREDGKRRRVDLNEVVRRLLRLTHSDCIVRNCSISVQLASELPTVEVDAVQVEQVLLNLVFNAFDALNDTPSDRREVVIRTREVIRPGGAMAEVSVLDRGPGISEADLARIFEPFFTTKGNGLGMGLSIARSIIELHGGELRVQNSSRGGVVASFEIPCSTGSPIPV